MKIFVTVMMLFFGLYMMVFYVGMNEQGSRTYVGEQSFDNVEQALSFQASIIRDANNIGAKVEKSDLTIQSPPTINFRVVSPAEKYSIFGDVPVTFNYGELWQTQHGAKVANIVALIIMPLMLIGAIYCLWSKRVQNYFDKQNLG